MLPENTPTSSNTENEQDSGVCNLCGKQSICGGTGVVRYEVPLEDPRFGKLFHCPNYVPDLDTERLEKLRRLSNMHVFADKTFETFRTDDPLWSPKEQAALRAALNVARSYAENPTGWLLLEGTYGSGKTHLAAAIGNYRLSKGDGVLFITSPDLLDHLRATFGPNADVTYDDTFDRIRNAPVLILDDLGVENPSQWAMEKLFQLLNYRYTRRLPTVVTTNANFEMLDPRIRSRLHDLNMVAHIRMVSVDYRNPYRPQEADAISDLTVYGTMQFDNFDVTTDLTPDERENLQKALRAAREYAEHPEGWLLLMGSYGTGKTHLAAAIANHCHERGVEVVFVTVPDLLDYLRVTFNPGATSTFEGRFQLVRNASLLILDDLGTESATPWAKEKLYQLINYRYVTNKPTIFTTALKMEDIDERIQYRVADTRRVRRCAITIGSYVTRRKNGR